MLPPTVMADPISATTWPKAVVITAARANRASRATVHAVRHRPRAAGRRRAVVLPLESPSHADRRPRVRGPLGEGRGTGQDRGVVDRVRLLELGGIVELPEHQADVSPYGETPAGVPAQADVGSDGELRAELVPAGVARRRSADGHAQDASYVRGETPPSHAAGEDEMQHGDHGHDVFGGRSCITLSV